MKYYLGKAEPSDFHQKRKNEKTKKHPKNIKSFPPRPPGGGQHCL
jgi:hypothetical protein